MKQNTTAFCYLQWQCRTNYTLSRDYDPPAEIYCWELFSTGYVNGTLAIQPCCPSKSPKILSYALDYLKKRILFISATYKSKYFQIPEEKTQHTCVVGHCVSIEDYKPWRSLRLPHSVPYNTIHTAKTINYRPHWTVTFIETCLNNEKN